MYLPQAGRTTCSDVPTIRQLLCPPAPAGAVVESRQSELFNATTTSSLPQPSSSTSSASTTTTTTTTATLPAYDEISHSDAPWCNPSASSPTTQRHGCDLLRHRRDGPAVSCNWVTVNIISGVKMVNHKSVCNWVPGIKFDFVYIFMDIGSLWREIFLNPAP